MSSSDPEIKITADTKDVPPAMREAIEAVKEFGSQVKEHLQSISESFTRFNEALLAIKSLAAGGKAFQEVIESTEKLSDQARQLSQSFGISTQSASNINSALKLAGLTSEDYISAAQKMDRQLKSNEQNFTAVGVATRDANGALLPQQQILQNVIEALGQYKEGADRTIVAQALLGRGVGDIGKLLRLTTDEMNEGADIARKFGLVVGDEDVEAWHKFHEATAESEMAVQGIWKIIADGLRPTLMQLADTFNNEVAEAISAYKKLLSDADEQANVSGSTINVLRGVMDVLWQSVKDLGDIVSNVFGSVFKAVLVVSLELARLAIQGFTLMIVLLVTYIGQFANQLENDLGKAIATTIVRFETWADVANKALHLDWDGAKKAYADGMKEIDDIINDATQRRLKIIDDSDKKYNDAVKKIAGAVPKKSADNDNDEDDQDKPSHGTKTAPASLFKSSQGGKDTGKEEDRLRELKVEKDKLADEGSIKSEQVKNKEMLDLDKQTNAQYLANKLDLQQQLDIIDLEAAVDKQAAIKNDKVAYEKAGNDIIALTQKQAQEEEAIRHEMVMEAQKDYLKLGQDIKSSFSDSVASVLDGSKSMKQAFSDFASSVVSDLAKMASKKLTESLFSGLMVGSGGGGMLGGLLGSTEDGSGLIGGLSDIFDGFLASGGDASSGKGYIVGENGPEFFMPSANGTVYNQAQMSKMGGTTIHMTVNTPNSQSFRQNQGQMMADMHSALRQSMRNA